jgi:hypothetical protein
MLSVVAKEIMRLQGAGGEPFTAFLDSLIWTHTRMHGLPDSDVDTTIRVNIRDGGVDTTVRNGVVNDPTGWLSDVPTAWQYKATDNTNIVVGELLKGAAAKSQIASGGAFRLAIADDLPDDRRREWEQKLTAEARRIFPASPPARVVTADDLARWASRYPAFVLSFFKPGLKGNVLHLHAWSANARDATREFVPVPDWAAVRATLERHIDLSVPADRAVWPLQGEAGVGKTRLAFEVTSAIRSASALVIYCDDEDAVERVAKELANEPEARAILVADECGPETRAALGRTLMGHRARVRVIAIDNSGVRLPGTQPELLIQKMPNATLSQVLTTNYPEVPDSRRRAYADVAEGFPRLAADLCRFDAHIARDGTLGPVVPTVGEYLIERLTNDQLEAVSALSLVTKIGFNGEVGGELDLLCKFLNLDRREVERALHAVHDGPGFVARSGRYFYVTPEVVAQVAFEHGWRLFSRGNGQALMASVPEPLIQRVLDRTWRSGSEEVRRDCAAYFRIWADSTSPKQLRDLATVRRFVALVDTLPDQFLSRLRRLIEAATDTDLQDDGPYQGADGSWGSRRALVWMAERLAQFPEFFDDSERILLRLARVETEPGISNNATGIWRQLFRIYLSGTAVSFFDRLSRLRSHLHSSNVAIRNLAISALDDTVGHRASRMLGPSLVAGRIPPPDWRPRSPNEEAMAVQASLDLLRDAVELSDDVRAGAIETLTRHVRFFLARGFFPRLREVLFHPILSDAQLKDLIESLDAALAYDYAEDGTPRVRRTDQPTPPTFEEVLDWRNGFARRDFHTRLVASVGKDFWSASRVHDSVRLRNGTNTGRSLLQQEIEEVATILASDTALLRQEIPWLTSDAAPSAGDLGEALGRINNDGSLADLIVPSAAQSANRAFPRGYVHGLIRTNPDAVIAVRRLLEIVERQDPVAAVELAISAGQSAEPIKRALRLFRERRIPAAYLSDRHFVTGEQQELPLDQWLLLLNQLADAAEEGDELAERIGQDSLGLRIPYDVVPSRPTLLSEKPELAAVAWRLLEARAIGGDPVSGWWRQLAVALAGLDVQRVVRRVSALLSSDNHAVREEADTALQTLAAYAPQEVMKSVGEQMLDNKVGWRFFILGIDEILKALPESVVTAWLASAGVEGARRVARSLPVPYVDSLGNAIVPPLTAWVLQQFESDDRTFKEFCAGVHNLQVYSGDIAAQHESEAETARRFLDHPLRRVREWAAYEELSATRDAERSRQDEAEYRIP